MNATSDSKGTILIVDDNPTNLQVLLDALSDRGFERLVSVDGEMAIEQASYAQPDLILLDVMMPGIDGFETCRRLKQREDTRDIPVIFMTALSDTENKVDGLQVGAVDYVTKPMQHEEVIARVSTHLALRNLQRELKGINSELQQANDAISSANQALRQSEERYALAVRGAKDGIWDWDLRGGTVYYSPRWAEMIGHAGEELGGAPDTWFERVHPDDVRAVKSAIDDHVAGRTPHCEIEYRIRHKDDGYRWMLGRGIAVRDDDGVAYRMSGSQTDITEGKVVDGLTGLPNRVLFTDRLERSIERARDDADHRFMVMALGVDRFSIVNDSLGRRVGDELLAELARRLESRVEEIARGAGSKGGALVARLSGDEFAVLLDGVGAQAQATEVAKQAGAAIKEPFTVAGRQLFPSASIGIVSHGETDCSPMTVLCEAETAMHHAKVGGAGRFAVFNGRMQEETLQRLQLESDLWQAIERDELELHYQPIVSLATGDITGCEALLRWKRGHGDLVSPAEFIPIAEETGAILPIGEWALREACAQQRRWDDAGYSRLQTAINVSVRQFQRQDLPRLIRGVLDAGRVQPEKIKVEITENMAIHDMEYAIATLTALREMGVQISMDDFGTGHSSLSHLARLPIDYLKIDRSFVMDLPDDAEKAALVGAILAMARSLGLQVIAEGVETEAQLDFLRSRDCQEMQGYLFSPPVPATRFNELLEQADVRTT